MPAGAAETPEIAIEGDYLYFSQDVPSAVGRMNLDGTNINPVFIEQPTQDDVNFFAVDNLTSAGSECDAAIKALKKAKKKLKNADTPAAKAKAKKKVKKAKKKKKACGGLTESSETDKSPYVLGGWGASSTASDRGP